VTTIFATTAQRLAIFRSCFSGLDHVYGTYDPNTGRVWQVKSPVTDQVIADHLAGRRPYGVYLLVGDRTGAVATDFDDDNAEAPLKFIHRAAELGIAAELERSKSKGYHCWIFADAGGIPAAQARHLVRVILNDIGMPNVEIFPKQDRLGLTEYGNFINAPLFGRLVCRHRSVFLNPADGLKPYADQWEPLASVQRLTETKLDTILSSLPSATSSSTASPPRASRTIPVSSNAGNPSSPRPPGYRLVGLAPCARRMLAGVDGYQRVICFRLGVHFSVLGMPSDLALAALNAWARKNQPASRRIITPGEIETQVRDAYMTGYRSYGCEDPGIQRYCDSACPLWKRRNAPAQRDEALNNLAERDNHQQEKR